MTKRDDDQMPQRYFKSTSVGTSNGMCVWQRHQQCQPAQAGRSLLQTWPRRGGLARAEYQPTASTTDKLASMRSNNCGDVSWRCHRSYRSCAYCSSWQRGCEDYWAPHMHLDGATTYVLGLPIAERIQRTAARFGSSDHHAG